MAQEIKYECDKEGVYHNNQPSEEKKALRTFYLHAEDTITCEECADKEKVDGLKWILSECNKALSTTNSEESKITSNNKQSESCDHVFAREGSDHVKCRLCGSEYEVM